MQVIYKILFEVRLLHEFYLTRSDGSSIFDGPSAADRDAFLQDFSNSSQRSISTDIDYIIPAPSQRLFKNHRLKLVRTYSGFKIAIAVNRTIDNGQIAWQPVAPLPPDLSIPILLVRTNSDFDRYTNRRLSPTLSSLYYISNDNAAGTGIKTFPFLTNAIPARSNTAAYEQGELSRSFGVVSAFYLDSDGIAKFAPVAGNNFLTEADRNLVTPSFQYYFREADNVVNAVFTLKDRNNRTIYTTSVSSDTPLQTVSLRVDAGAINTVPATVAEDATVYTLSVKGSNKYKKVQKLVFLREDLASVGAWGMINIFNQPGNKTYSLIDDKGLLFSRYDPQDGTMTVAPPLFEVWIKSRFSFWRYSNDQALPLKDSYPDILRLTGSTLVSLVPQSHTYTPIAVAGRKLPNPKLFSVVKPEGQRIFADIIVPASDIFPLGP